MADQSSPQRATVVMVAPYGAPDLAVLKIEDYAGPFVPKVDWSGQNARQGASAALIGFPAGLGNAVDQTYTVRTLMSAGILARVTAETINQLIRSMQRRLGVTSIVVTHDIHSAFTVGDRLAFLDEGRIRFEGQIEEARQSRDPVLRNFLEGGGYG